MKDVISGTLLNPKCHLFDIRNLIASFSLRVIEHLPYDWFISYPGSVSSQRLLRPWRRLFICALTPNYLLSLSGNVPCIWRSTDEYLSIIFSDSRSKRCPLIQLMCLNIEPRSSRLAVQKRWIYCPRYRVEYTQFHTFTHQVHLPTRTSFLGWVSPCTILFLSHGATIWSYRVAVGHVPPARELARA